MKALKERSDAKAARDNARTRLFGTVAGVRKAAAPSALADLAKSAATARVVDLAVGSGKKLRRRPEFFIGALTGALLFLFRKPIIGAAKRLTKEKDDG